MKKILTLTLLFIFLCIGFIYCEPSNGGSKEDGKILVVNSWGEGYWENVDDGKYWITYEAAKKVGLYCLLWNADATVVKALVTFQVSHNVRSDCTITFRVGTYEKQFTDIYNSAGDKPFPNNLMVLDVSEYYNNISGQTVYLDITDGNSSTETVTSVTNTTLYLWTTNTFNGSFANANHPISLEGGSTPIDNTTETWNGSVPTYSAMPLKTSNYGNLNIVTAKPTEKQFAKMKAMFGTYEEGKNYNKIYQDKWGTGLKPPTEEQWEVIKNTPSFIIGIEGSSKSVVKGSADLSSNNYFPPIGNQGMKGSCSSFSTTYYAQTYYMARNKGWNLSGVNWVCSAGDYPGEPDSNLDKIMSPQFTYHLTNQGGDNGSSPWDNGLILTEMGVANWEDFPYSDDEVIDWEASGYDTTCDYGTGNCGTDEYTWPDETSFTDAPINRGRGYISGSSYTVGGFYIEDDDDITFLKQFLDEGYIITTMVDANYYDYLDDDDLWKPAVLSSSWELNHANTIVGYKD